jgi:hypothetical protein
MLLDELSVSFEILRIIELDNAHFAISCIKFSPIIIWNFSTKLIRHYLSDSRYGGLHVQTKTLILLKSGHLASGSCCSAICIWNQTIDGPCVKILNGHVGCVNDLVSLSYETLLSCSADRTIKVWNLNSQTVKKTLIGHLDEIASLSMLDDNATLASGSQDGQIFIWNLESGKMRNVLYGHLNRIARIVCLEGMLFASASHDELIKVWNHETAEELRTLVGHSDAVTSIVLLKTGHLASASYDTFIKVWNYTSGQLLDEFRGHQNNIESLCLLRTGNLASGALDRKIKIWHTLNKYNKTPAGKKKKRIN